MNMRAEAKEILKAALALPLSKFQAAEVKMELADILLLEEKFNQALIYYSQIEEDLKNDVIGHEASLQSAKTSYYKADFDWAQKQFKELKTASSQLIANDALEYFLLLNDNKAEDSLQVALKKFARADYLVYQNKNDLALQAFKAILAEHKGEQIESVTLLRIGRIYERQGDFTTALQYYDNIIKNFGESIYVDEALFFSAEIYNTKLPDPLKAKALFETIIFNHQDSIHFIEARKRFRELRGDTAS
jgi:tetratricopeptide (TPR) repeat protein